MLLYVVILIFSSLIARLMIAEKSMLALIDWIPILIFHHNHEESSLLSKPTLAIGSPPRSDKPILKTLLYFGRETNSSGFSPRHGGSPYTLACLLCE